MITRAVFMIGIVGWRGLVSGVSGFVSWCRKVDAKIDALIKRLTDV